MPPAEKNESSLHRPRGVLTHYDISAVQGMADSRLGEDVIPLCTRLIGNEQKALEMSGELEPCRFLSRALLAWKCPLKVCCEAARYDWRCVGSFAWEAMGTGLMS